MALTYQAIATVTVGSGGAANIEFANIPQTYTDLKIVLSVRTALAQTFGIMAFEFNGSSASFSGRYLEGNGSAVLSGTGTNIVVTGANATASTFSNAEIYIPNYTTSNNKSISSDQVNENNATSAIMELYTYLWSNTAAITSIKLTSADTIQQHSTATLYGIKNTV